MSEHMRKLVFFSGIAASAFCLAGGLWILTAVGLNHGNDAMTTAIGLYFIGKAFFVGPMLWVAAGRTARE